MRDAIMLAADARNAEAARAWVTETLSSRGFCEREAGRLANQIANAWYVAGSAFYGSARARHEMLVAIRDGEPGSTAIELVGDTTISRRLAEQVADEVGMTAMRGDEIDNMLCLTLVAQRSGTASEKVA